MELVNDLTEYLVERYTPFDSTREYYSHYTLTNEKLAAVRMNTRILSAADDPVIPVRTLDPLRTIANGDFDLSDMGGHCAFIEDYRLRSALDAYTVDYFQRLKGGA